MYKVGLTGGIGTGKSYIGKIFAAYGVKIIDSDVIARVVVLPGSPTLAAISAHFGEQVITSEGALNRRALRELVFGNPEQLAALNGLMHPAIHQLIEDYCHLVESHQPLPEVYYRTVAAQQKAQASAQAAASAADQASASAFAQDSASASAQDLASADEELGIALDPTLVFSEERPAPYVILDIPLLFESGWDREVDRILVVDCEPSLQLARVMQRDRCSAEQAAAIIARQCPREFKLTHATEVITTDSPSIADKRQAVLNLHCKYLAQARAASAIAP